MSKLSIGLIDRNRRHLSTLLALKNGVRTVEKQSCTAFTLLFDYIYRYKNGYF
ncbi:hypothetical protein Wxf_03184 [Armadillidium vulgare]|nr:hypothetical protein Wxf_03184 [Armadillidium vulgare] [Wolbachia endosymbiont of Armadillidium vulgare]